MAASGGSSSSSKELNFFNYENLMASYIKDEDRWLDPYRAASDADSFDEEKTGEYVRLRNIISGKEVRAAVIAKIHLSIATKSVDPATKTETDTHEFVKQAWNAILPIMLKHQIISSKVYMLGLGKICQEGKPIVFYIRNAPGTDLEAYWLSFLREVEDALILHSIPAGNIPILRYQGESAEAAYSSEHSRLENSIGASPYFYYSEELVIDSPIPAVPEYLKNFRTKVTTAVASPFSDISGASVVLMPGIAASGGGSGATAKPHS